MDIKKIHLQIKKKIQTKTWCFSSFLLVLAKINIKTINMFVYVERNNSLPWCTEPELNPRVERGERDLGLSERRGLFKILKTERVRWWLGGVVVQIFSLQFLLLTKNWRWAPTFYRLCPSPASFVWVRYSVLDIIYIG